MKHLFIEHEYPINKNFCLKLLTITLTMSKNQGCQEKKFEFRYNKKRGCLEKKIENKYNKNQGFQEKIEVKYNKNRGNQEKLNKSMTKIKDV